MGLEWEPCYQKLRYHGGKIDFKKGGALVPPGGMQRLDTKCSSLETAPLLFFLLISSRIYSLLGIILILYIPSVSMKPPGSISEVFSLSLFKSHSLFLKSKQHSPYSALIIMYVSLVEPVLCAKHDLGNRC